MLKGLGNLANLGSIMKQAQEMGGKLQEVNEQLKVRRATGSAGGGMVEVEVNGVAEVLAVRIDPSLIEKGDVEMIEDLLPAAFNAAQAKAKEMHAEAMQGVTAGFDLPGLGEAMEKFTGPGPGPGGSAGG